MLHSSTPPLTCLGQAYLSSRIAFSNHTPNALTTTGHAFMHNPQMPVPGTMVGNHEYNKQQERRGSFSLRACEGDRPKVNKQIISGIPGTNGGNKTELWERQRGVLLDKVEPGKPESRRPTTPGTRHGWFWFGWWF